MLPYNFDNFVYLWFGMYTEEVNEEFDPNGQVEPNDEDA